MLKIFDWLRSRSPIRETATELYGSIVAQAREPVFYTRYGIADVAEKRYEMIVLHIVLVQERLRAIGEPSQELAQRLNEMFVSDLDGSVREMAVGDTKVPNSVRKAAGGLLDRDLLYRDAFAALADVPGRRADERDATPVPRGGGSVANDSLSLDGLLNELLFDGCEGTVANEAMTAYVAGARNALSEWRPGTDAAGPPFPKPQSFLEAAP